MRKKIDKFGLIILILFISPILCASMFIINPIYINENKINTNSEFNSKQADTSGTFITEIQGKKYLAEIITEENVEEIKDGAIIRDLNKDYNQIIDGHGTGYAPPTEESLNELIGKIRIIDIAQESVKSPLWGASKDISSDIYFAPVGDQGFQGSCTSWANVYYAYGYMEAKDYGWDASTGNPNYLLSPAWSYNKLATYDYGSMVIETGELVKEWGAATLNSMPYDDNDLDSWGNETAWREAPYHRPLDFTLLSYGSSTINTIKGLLDSEVPVTFGIDAGEFSNGLDDSPADYILNSTEYDSTSLNHAQCIVGYDDAITDGTDIGAFRVVNSWGDAWIDNGFYWLTYDAFDELGVVSSQFIGFYTDRIDYEPTLIATWEFSESTIRSSDIITLGVGLQGSLNQINPHYTNDFNNMLPAFMAFDISDFQSNYNADNNVLFSLQVTGRYDIPGTISSFKVERYQSGIWQETTPESFDIPKSTPGYAHCSFNAPAHELKVLLELPTKPDRDISYTINATVINRGTLTENNVDLQLIIDELLVDSATGLSLLPDDNHTINFPWTPDEYKCCNITAYAPPVSSEFYEDNNFISKKVRVQNLTNYEMTLGYTFTWIDASGGTEVLVDDGRYTTVSLPFDFIFYDHAFSSVSISEKGYLSFADCKPGESMNFPFPNPYAYIIAPFWDDLELEIGGSVYVQSFGTYWVVEWEGMYHDDNDYVGTFEVVLYDSGDIIFNYEDIDYIESGSGYTCGLNYGLDENYYNNYQGLSASTTDYSIRFNQSNLNSQMHCDHFTLGVDVDDTIILKLKSFDGDLVGWGDDPEEFFGPGAVIGALNPIKILDISTQFSYWNLSTANWNWSTDPSTFNDPPHRYSDLEVFNNPKYLGQMIMTPNLGMIIPTPVEEYLMAVDWYEYEMIPSVFLDGRTISCILLIRFSPYPQTVWVNFTYGYDTDGVIETYKVAVPFGETIFEFVRYYIGTNGDDGDDDNGNGNGKPRKKDPEPPITPLIILGSSIAGGCIIFAIIAWKKNIFTKTKRE